MAAARSRAEQLQRQRLQSVLVAVLVVLQVNTIISSKTDEAVPALEPQPASSTGRSLLQLVGEGSDKCVSCDALGRPFVEQPPVTPLLAAQPEVARGPIPCDALRSISFSSSLPVVIVDTGGKRIESLEDAEGYLTTCNAPGGADYSGPATIEIRGSSSARYAAKKSFSVRLKPDPAADAEPGAVSSAAYKASDQDEGEASTKGISFMGFPAGEKFMLYGPENDMTQGLRNWVAYGLWRAMGRWASRLQYCELFLVLDGSATLDAGRHYWGLYLAGEEIDRGRWRVPVKPLKMDLDLSGGYILRYEHGKNKHNASIIGPLPSTGMPWLLKYPGKKVVLPSVVYEYLSSFLEQVEAAIWTGGAWRRLLDPEALTDYMLGTEVTKNPDGYRGSVYAYKDRQGPLVMGPMWDYNEAFGLCCGYPIEGYLQDGVSNGLSGGSAISPQGWRFNICQERRRCLKDPIDGVAQWYMRLWKQDPEFKMGVAKRWQDLRNGTLNNTWFSSQIDAATKAIYPEAVTRNYARWGSVLRVPGDGYATDAAHFEGHVQRLSAWLAAHLAWMDQQLDQVLNEMQTDGAGASSSIRAGGTGSNGDSGAAGLFRALIGAGPAASDSSSSGANPLARIFGRVVDLVG